MYLFEKQGVPWPPSGWNHFDSIKKSCGQAVYKDPLSATVSGMTYHIDPNPLKGCTGQLKYTYFIRIDGWSYSIHNESQEFPILSFQLKERKIEAREKKSFITDLKVMARPTLIDENTAHRTILSSLFLIKQIDSQNLPDYERILKLYRLHPDIVKKPARSVLKPKNPLHDFWAQDKGDDINKA